MKIVAKLTLALLAGTCLVLIINGTLRVRRERAAFEADRIRDHEMIGRSLGAAMGAVWKLEGDQAAIRTIDAVSGRLNTIHIRWVGTAEAALLPVDMAALSGIQTGKPLTRLVGEPADGSVWRTYVPLDVDGRRRGVIELSESTSREQRFVQTAVCDTLAMALALAALSAALSFGMSQWLVGAPVRALSEKARRVGRGDFSGPILIRREDELTELAREMNAMCDRLASTMAQLRHADRLATVGTLASGVAHELGTPLNVISARAEMIASGDAKGDDTRQYAFIIMRSAEKMAKIIRTLLQFARRQTVKRTRCDLQKLTNESVGLLRPLADKRSVQLLVEPLGAEVSAYIDADQMQQVVTNLVMNGIQAMQKPGVVEVGVRRTRSVPPANIGGSAVECVCIRVQDEGAGIAPEDLAHVFEPFFTTKDVGDGTGLGLAVAYEIVREHGGWFDVKSQGGVGTTFFVYLPNDATR